MSDQDAIPEPDHLRAVLRDARRRLKKLNAALDKAESADTLPAPQWRFTADQLTLVARRAMAGDGYARIAKELGYDGDLHSALQETFRAAGCPGTRHTWPGAEALQRWVLSFGDAEAAYRWHLAVANDRASQ